MLLGLTLEELIICSDRVAWISDDYFESLLLRQSIYFTSTIPACNLVWGTYSPTLLYEVEYIHARAAKIIYRLSDVSNQEALTTAEWESINSMYKRKLLTFMYQVYKSELPDNIIRLFSSSNCCYDLRNSIKFEVPRFNLEVGRNSLRYRGALFWNSIPDNLKRAPSLNILKSFFKKIPMAWKCIYSYF